MRAASIAVALVLAPVPVTAQPPTPPTVHYTIDATLEVDARAVHATQHVRWVNRGAVATSELCLHLYLNAFANTETSYLRAHRKATRRWRRRAAEPWGALELHALQVNGVDALASLTYVRPDDGNPHDSTLARLRLSTPVAPGEGVELTVEFTAHLPRALSRTGHAAPFFMVAQWYPKIGVFNNGRWQCHQYLPFTEFFADPGRFDVFLDVPRDVVVAHTGTRVAERPAGPGRRLVATHADAVHDFAWAVDTDFVVDEERVDDVQVRVLLQPEHADQMERIFQTVQLGLERFGAWFGPYPYAELTVVDPGRAARGVGGMEYPTLFTVDTRWWMPDALHFPEAVTAHELAHQWWYGVVATDEVEAAWLDEGLASYSEALLLEALFGAEGNLGRIFGVPVDSVARHRAVYLGAPSSDAISAPSHRVRNRRSYRATAYAKVALLLHTLERHVGRPAVLEALRAYYDQWQFGHPRGPDLRALLAPVAAGVGDDLLGQILDGTGVVDYAVARVRSRPDVPLAGRGVEPRDDALGEPWYHTEVVLERRGEVVLPVDVLLVFADGSETRRRWTGAERWHRIEMETTEPLDYAVVDPDERLPLDVDRLNNSRTREPASRGLWRVATRWAVLFQHALHVLTAF